MVDCTPVAGRALYVDDSTPYVAPMAQYLSRRGIETDGEGDPEAAWRRLSTGAYRMAVIDLWMQERRLGCELIRRLRAEPGLADVALIGMTGSSYDLLEDALMAGADQVSHRLSIPEFGVPELKRLARSPDAPRVLVVEDEPGIAVQAHQALRTAPGLELHVRVCDSASRALFQAEQWRPDIVLLDLLLSGPETGLDFLRDLRARRPAGEVSVIVMTASRGVDIDIACRDLGADDFIEKPFRSDDLLSRVRAAVRRIPPRPVSWGRVTADTMLRRAVANGIDLALTPKEFAVFLLLLRARGGAVTTKRLVGELWERTAEPGHKLDAGSLYVHICALKKKLAPYGELENEEGVGYRLGKTRP